jgi:hypothetical protein
MDRVGGIAWPGLKVDGRGATPTPAGVEARLQSDLRHPRPDSDNDPRSNVWVPRVTFGPNFQTLIAPPPLSVSRPKGVRRREAVAAYRSVERLAGEVSDTVKPPPAPVPNPPQG